MLENFVLFFAGLILLVKGADYFVEAAAKIAKIFGISDFIIGLTIVAIGTSLPEVASSIAAGYSGEFDLALGTVIGSNISNIALVLAIAAVFNGAIIVKKKLLEKDVFIMLLVTILFYYFALDGLISKNEGFIFIILFIGYLLFLLGFMRRFAGLFNYERYLRIFFGTERVSLFNWRTYAKVMKAGIDPETYKKLLGLNEGSFEERLGKRIDKGERKEAKEIYRRKLLYSIFGQFLILIISGAAVAFGAQILVDGASQIALFLGIPASIVGLLMVSVGTSLPELGVTISSVKKGFTDILVGNIVGSNVSNILLVIGLTSFLIPLTFSVSTLLIPLFFMIVFAFLLSFFVGMDFNVDKLAGFGFLALYAVFVYFVFSLSIPV